MCSCRATRSGPSACGHEKHLRPDFAAVNTQASPTWRGTASPQGQSALFWLVPECTPLCAAPPPGDASACWRAAMSGMHSQGEMMSRVLSARLELTATAATSRLSRHRVFTPTIAFDPPGLGSTTCDRITSSTKCHIEKHAEPHEKERDASKIGECVLDDSEEECSDGCCCFTKGTKEECRGYQLDNYTLTALVESGNEEYQHFQNATGHWVRRLGRKVCPALVGVLVAILGQRRRPRRVELPQHSGSPAKVSQYCFHCL